MLFVTVTGRFSVAPRLARLGNEAVSATRYSLDKLRPSGSLAECFSQERDVLSEISFLDEGVRPDALHQVVLGHDLPAVLYESNQYVENFRRERNQFTFAQQDAFRDFEAETAEFVAVIVLLTHKTGLRNIF